MLVDTLPLLSASYVGLGTHLFVKVPRPKDGIGTLSIIESSCHLLLAIEPLKGRGNPVKYLAQGHIK